MDDTSLPPKLANPYCIAFLGAHWWGSDARALAMEFRKSGHVVIENNYEDFLPTKWNGLFLRACRKAIRPWLRADYNQAVRGLARVEAVDFILVFKGMLLNPSTLLAFKNAARKCYLFYPDVSFSDHGANIQRCIQHYDCVFTTKPFHLESGALQTMAADVQLVRHGFDPDVHRPIPHTERLQASYGCDVSFVGCWSRKKERTLHAAVSALSALDFKIWGPGWGRAHKKLRAKWQGRAAYGDELAAIYSLSKVNLGLLSEAGSDTESGDTTTARTWQIPASGGFLLHEDTDEVRQFFQAGQEIALFSDTEDLKEKISYYVGVSSERACIRDRGHKRAITDSYTYRQAVDQIIEYHRLQANNVG